MDQNEKTTEDKIFEAASRIFEEKGFTGSRMQEIADRAGINKALLHYYFRTKEKLFDAVFSKLAGIMFKKLFSCLDNDLPLEQKLAMFYKEHIGFLQKHPGLPAFVFHEINRNPERIARIFSNEQVVIMRKKFYKQLDEEIEAGVIRPVDKMQLVVNIVALSVFPFAARGLVSMILGEGKMKFNDFVEDRKTLLPLFIVNALRNP